MHKVTKPIIFPKYWGLINTVNGYEPFGKIPPSITIKELSRIITNYRKRRLRKIEKWNVSYALGVTDTIYDLRKDLQLRKRGRK